MKQKRFVCKTCGYEYIGATAPDVCPICGKPASEFEDKGVVGKKGLDTNSNAYTIIYATIIVVIVALLLAVVSSALKPKQEANVALDTKKQILSSLNLDLKGQDVDALYAEVIEETKVDDKTLYIATLEGETKYIIPMTGVGLWGGIWGYFALNDDKNTVYGTYFNHAGETPGLGGEITTAYFQNRFVGKHIQHDGKVAGLGIMKAGQTAEGMEQVDAISGATITSKGVENMINSTLNDYATFLTPAEEVNASASEAVCDTVATDSVQ